MATIEIKNFPGLLVKFSKKAVPCDSIARIAAAEDGIGITVIFTDGSWMTDESMTFSEACSLWDEALRESRNAK